MTRARKPAKQGLPIDLELPTADGRMLAATWWQAGGNVIVMAGATGVKRDYYRHAAVHFAARGYSVLSFDYRGIGGSADAADGQTRMADWGRLDLDAALRHAREYAGAGRVFVVAHSVGGQVLPLAASADDVDAAVFLASQSGHWRKWDAAQWPKIALLWFILIPVLTRFRRDFPSPWFGMGEPLPRGVAREWAHWGRHHLYLLGRLPEAREAFARLRFPLAALHLADDHDFGPRKAVDELASWYVGCDAAVRTIRGSDVGRERIGHFDPYRPGHEALWDAIADWLDEPVRGAFPLGH